jgi:hypothetical protein
MSERHPSYRRHLTPVEPAEDALVIASFDGEGGVVQYLFGRGEDFEHKHPEQDYKRWYIEHEYHEDLEAVLCIRSPLAR